MDIADRKGPAFRRALRSAECLSDAAMRFGSRQLKALRSRSSASLLRMTSADQYFLVLAGRLPRVGLALGIASSHGMACLSSTQTIFLDGSFTGAKTPPGPSGICLGWFCLDLTNFAMAARSDRGVRRSRSAASSSEAPLAQSAQREPRRSSPQRTCAQMKASYGCALVCARR
jgi:hypothetical protein